jgi:acetyl/propionyl-CoA carboxylase alpha subunit
LVRILQSPEFLAGDTDTQFIDRADVAALSAPLTADHRLHALAATLAGQQARRDQTPVLGTIPSGWRNAPSQLQLQTWDTPQGSVAVGYHFGRDGLIVELDGEATETVLHTATPDTVDMTANGIRRRYRIARVARQMWVSSPLGHTALTQISRFPEPEIVEAPGSLLSPMPGTVVQISRAEGDVVTAGEVVVVIEAMKMEHAVRSPSDGIVSSVPVTVGQHVDADHVLAVVEEA